MSDQFSTSSTSRRYSRRQALRVGGLATTQAALAATVPVHLPAHTARQQRDEAVVHEIRRVLNDAFRGREMGLYFSYFDKNRVERVLHEIQVNRVYPVASSFKAAVVLYYFMTLPEELWDWGPRTPVYRMAVYSNNGTTGEVIKIVGDYLGAKNPIAAYNDFVTETLGLRYGLYQWTFAEFYTPTNGFSDMRFAPSRFDTSITGRAVNFSTPAELAEIFRFMVKAEDDPRWERDAHFRAAIEASRELLSITAVEYISPLERAIAYTPHYSKDGSLRPIDIGTNVLNDSGIWQMPDGGSYLISFMSTQETEVAVQDALSQVAEAMRMYQRYLHPNYFHVITEPSAPLHPGELDYGFVRETGIELFSAPDLGAPRVENAVRPTSLFGTTYLMYGALARVRALDDTWGEIIADDAWDKTFTWPVYLRLEKLQIISRDHAEPIGYVTGAPENTSKYIILDIYQRRLTLFEGTTPIFKTPVIVNTEATPRSLAVLSRGYMARNMPNYPGVPYTYFLHGSDYLDRGGFAVHGSPWHLWSETVTERTTIQRLTHGCINVPDWPVPIPYYGKEMRADEFVFRWNGGFRDPARALVYQVPGRDPVRIYSVNNMVQDLPGYTLPNSARAAGAGWGDLIRAVNDKELDVPDFYYR